METPHHKMCGAHAKAQNRTADTRIFSPVLYHLSYLGGLGDYSRANLFVNRLFKIIAGAFTLPSLLVSGLRLPLTRINPFFY